MQLIRGGRNRGFGIGQLMGMAGQVNEWYADAGGTDVSVGNRDSSLLNTTAQSPSWRGGGRRGYTTPNIFDFNMDYETPIVDYNVYDWT